MRGGRASSRFQVSRFLFYDSVKPYTNVADDDTQKNNRASLIKILKTKIPGMSGIPWVLATLNGHVESPEQYNHP